MFGFPSSQSIPARWPILAAILFVSGTAYSQQADRITRSEFTQYKDNVTREFNRQRTAYNEDIRILKEQTQALLENYRAHNDVLSDLHSEVGQLKKAFAGKGAETPRERSRVLDSLDNLEQRIANEIQARQTADERIITEVSKLLERSLNQTQRSGSMGTASNPSGKIYTVVKGDTLSAIAHAFDISLARLKAVNGLQADTIHIGQELNIPDTK